MSKLLKTEQQQDLLMVLQNIELNTSPEILGAGLFGELKFWILDLKPKRMRKDKNNNNV